MLTVRMAGLMRFRLQRYGKPRKQLSRSYKSLSQFNKVCIYCCLTA